MNDASAVSVALSALLLASAACGAPPSGARSIHARVDAATLTRPDGSQNSSTSVPLTFAP